MFRNISAMLLASLLLVQPAMAMSPCRSNNVEAASEIIVEARVKALLISESGLFGKHGMTTRMVKADLEIKRVIKGRFAGKEATVYGSAYVSSLGPLSPLVLMAAVYGFGEKDTLELGFSRQKFGEFEMLWLDSCSHVKLPELAKPTLP